MRDAVAPRKASQPLSGLGHSHVFPQFQEKGSQGFARFGGAALWLKRHLVAEEHIGLTGVGKGLQSPLSRIQIRKTYPTFLASDRVP